MVNVWWKVIGLDCPVGKKEKKSNPIVPRGSANSRRLICTHGRYVKTKKCFQRPVMEHSFAPLIWLISRSTPDVYEQIKINASRNKSRRILEEVNRRRVTCYTVIRGNFSEFILDYNHFIFQFVEACNGSDHKSAQKWCSHLNIQIRGIRYINYDSWNAGWGMFVVTIFF